MKIMWDKYFTKETGIDGTVIKTMENAWPLDKDSFINTITLPLYERGTIDVDQREAVERLVDAFNRHGWRAAFFVWSIMTIFQKDYRSWDKDFFVKFYTSRELGRGLSPKVLACFLQQGFDNSDVIPIDTWVESFYFHALGIDSLDEFFLAFDDLGKIERMIWLSSQGNKTNMKTFFDMLWCTRFGDLGNKNLRGANPIACYECKLRQHCPGYQKVKDRKVLLKDRRDVIIDTVRRGQVIQSPMLWRKQTVGLSVRMRHGRQNPEEGFQENGNGMATR